MLGLGGAFDVLQTSSSTVSLPFITFHKGRLILSWTSLGWRTQNPKAARSVGKWLFLLLEMLFQLWLTPSLNSGFLSNAAAFFHLPIWNSIFYFLILYLLYFLSSYHHLVYMYGYVCMCVCLYVCVYKYTYMCICVYKYTYMYSMYVYVNTYTHIHLYIHI